MSIKDKEKWNQRYNCKRYLYGKEPSAFLRQKINTLTKGDALVLAMGEGRNAVYLAQCGYRHLKICNQKMQKTCTGKRSVYQ